ncbi:unnamed protein product [Protopolystoma xenopodis]|uniref:Uncharacterized protein n=1 Tax=Protopolystoma xenopodis TaxID=117903 RepID=A0A3S5B4Z7_9PLAT|nr:unnamed protein product [Protopolystoma xenopodis]
MAQHLPTLQSSPSPPALLATSETARLSFRRTASEYPWPGTSVGVAMSRLSSGPSELRVKSLLLPLCKLMLSMTPCKVGDADCRTGEPSGKTHSQGFDVTRRRRYDMTRLASK